MYNGVVLFCKYFHNKTLKILKQFFCFTFSKYLYRHIYDTLFNFVTFILTKLIFVYIE
ncbi:hypothetical protein SATG_02314 [Staphylococcus aureus subsp. aureus D139]|nr:conserved hypothetical protein [Staphylococcus aureus A9635]EFB49062.1 hypothetical protein SATG_02314 [Staphylococcus aureus subsp. aureus D139]